MSTDVLKYLDSKGIDYRLDGREAIFKCPFCGQDEGQFGLNIDSFRGQCFRGKCAAKVNEITFKRKFGDSVEQKSNLEDDVVSQAVVAKKQTQAETVPDVVKAHQALLEDDELLNYLNDERGLSLETVKKAMLGVGIRRFGPKGAPNSKALMFPYFENSKAVGVKYRSLPPEKKDFRYTAGREVGLYRQDVIKDGMESLLILEGESDTLTLVEHGIDNVIGVSGCDSKDAYWESKFDLPKKLYLVFDNDEAGQKGALGFATRYGISRFHNVIIPQDELPEPIGDRTVTKDVNEWFMAGHTVEEFNDLLKNARPFDIEGVTTMDAAFDKLLKRMAGTGTLAPKYSFKWDSVNKRAKGINDGDMIVILAPGKTGKTTFCLNQAEFMAETYGINPHLDVMEMDPEDLQAKWTAHKLGVLEDDLTVAQVEEGRQIARSRDNGFMYTRSDPSNLEEYFEFLRRIKRRYNSGMILIDNFQILVDKTIGRGNMNNRPAYMSIVSKKIKGLAGELRVPIFLISQPSKLQDNKMVGANDSEGSSTLTKDCDIFIVMNRNTEVNMTLAQRQSVGNLETNQSHSDDVYVDVVLSRRSAGGNCTLKIDGARSTIREYNDEELNSNTKKVLAGNIEISQEAVSI